jgi:hypothetical protein
MARQAISWKERFWTHVDKQDNGCWIWIGKRKEKYYPGMRAENQVEECVHRLSWKISYGNIPDEFDVRHKCNNKRCVNPEHLYLVSVNENDKIKERFWSKVDKSGGGNTCWAWLAATTRGGYGNFSIDGKPRRAHRVVWEIVNGKIPDGLDCLHTCDNPPCVNPAHLFLGTKNDNMADMRAKGRFPTGDKHWFRLRPGTAASGDNNGSRTHPECLRRGSNHPSKIHPERVARGEQLNHNKLTKQSVVEIRKIYKTNSMSIDDLAKKYNVSTITISRAARNKTWCWIENMEKNNEIAIGVRKQ